MFHRPNLVVQPNVFHVSNKPNRKGRLPYRSCMTNRVIFCSLAGSLLFGISTAAHPQISTPIPWTGVTKTAESFDPAAATQAWLATVPADTRKKSDAYFEGGYWLILWNFLLAVGISIFLLASRISARLRDFAERICHGCRGSCQLPLQVLLYAVPYFLLVAALSFPLQTLVLWLMARAGSRGARA